MAEYLEGRHAVVEALSAEVPLKRVLIATGVEEDAGIRRMLDLAEESGVVVQRVKRQVLDSMSRVHGAHQGVMAEARPFRYSDIADVVSSVRGQSHALIIVCDHVQDPGNLGAIVRSADVVGAAGVVIPQKRAAAVTPVAYKSSAGAVSYVPICLETNLSSVLRRLKDEGFWVVGASEKADTDLWDADLSGRIVLVMGAEGFGLSRLVRETCDTLVKLPQKGHVSSLNVAQATTAIAYEWLRRAQGDGGVR